MPRRIGYPRPMALLTLPPMVTDAWLTRYDDSHGFLLFFYFLPSAKFDISPTCANPPSSARSFPPFPLLSSLSALFLPTSVPSSPFCPLFFRPFPLLPLPTSVPSSPFLPTITFALSAPSPPRPPSFPPIRPTILSPFPLLSSRPPPFPPFLPTCFLRSFGDRGVACAPGFGWSACPAAKRLCCGTRSHSRYASILLGQSSHSGSPFGSAGPALCPAGHARVCSSLTLGTHPTGHPSQGRTPPLPVAD